MTSDAILFFTSIPNMIWGLMNSFDIPGLGFTPGALIMGIISFKVISWVVLNIFNLGGNFVQPVEDKKPDFSAARLTMLNRNLNRRR